MNNAPNESKAGSNATAAECGVVDPFVSLRTLRTTLRQDLQITRGTYRGESSYVVFDPVSFRSHRLSLNDYRVISRLADDRTLSQCFDECVRAGFLEPEDEAQFYGFVRQLTALGLLSGQNVDSKLLYDRFLANQRAAVKSKWLGFLFLTIPLSNPDKFLDRTIGRVRFLFTPIALVAWLVGMIAVLSIVFARWDAFWQPLNSLLAVKNLLFMSIAFVGLKVWHELGHGYACKVFGGRIPEMGCKLIVGMPLAYVDASAAWSFPSRLRRIIVMLGGMYFELWLAILATFAWAYSPDSTLGAFAYQIVFMAGIATLLFNINPLMKFDGYFVLSDLLGMPNLRARSTQEVNRLLKRFALGLTHLASPARSVRDQVILVTYGVAASLYGVMLTISIAAVIATRLQTVGLVIAAVQISMLLWNAAKKLHQYLWTDEECAAVRERAKRVGWSLAIGVPVLIAFCPVMSSQYVQGVVTAVQTTQLRASTPGFVESVIHPIPDHVEAGQTLVRMRNVDVEAALATARVTELAAQRSMHLVSQIDSALEARQRETVITEIANREVAERVHNELQLVAPHAGRLASVLPRQAVGTFLRTGDIVATVAQGSTQVRAWLDQEQLATARLDVGQRVSVRIANDRTRTYTGTIRSVAPANKSKFEDIALTTVGDGTIGYDPSTGETTQEVFQLLVDVPDLDSYATMQGVSVSVRVPRRYESLGHWMARQTGRFVNSLFAGS